MSTRSRQNPLWSTNDTTVININRLLSRLEHNVLVDPSPQLRKSSLIRNKTSANIDYARTLMLNVEHSVSTSTSISSKAQKTACLNDLQHKRELLKQLNQRLAELDRLDKSEDEDEDDEEEEESTDDEDADSFPSYAPKIATDAGIEVTPRGGGEGNEAFQNAARSLTSELRRRTGQGGGGGAATEATPNANTTARASLFSKPPTSTSATSPPSTDALLTSSRHEQEALTTSLLTMATQLKQQSLHFGSTLETDKSVLSRATSGLDKSTAGMDAASSRMGTLRRMTEGKGWFARLRLYGLIFGLWIVAFLVVFVGPKIRF